MASSTSYHEPLEEISEETRDFHRALTSLQEELEAVDWYRQRADATKDEALRAILLHNLGEEIEHAVMILEWIRRHEPTFDKQLHTYMFTESPVVAIEEQAEAAEVAEAVNPPQEEISQKTRPSLTVGKIKGG